MKTIIITDKNPHIRELISRELEMAEYKTFIIISPEQVLEKLCSIKTANLIVLDPEIVNENFTLFFNRLLKNSYNINIVIHAYAEWREFFRDYKLINFIEKNGTSISNVKKIISTLVPV